MTRPSTIIILSLMCLLPLTAGGTAHRQYSPLVEFADDKPSEEIMRMAGKYAGQGKDAEAIVLYTVVADRFRSDLDDRGKNNCALALREIGDIYYKRGDYVNALDCFVKGVKLSEQLSLIHI